MAVAPLVAGFQRRMANLPGPLGSASSSVGGQPFLPLALGAAARLIVEVAFGANLAAEPQTWNWTDITADVRQANGQRVTISPMARADEFSTAQPAGCALELANQAGDYTANNPAGKWAPFVRRNTPLRVTVNLTGHPSDTALRFQGSINGWVPRWDTSASLSVVSVSASGTLRRLQQGKTPILSPIRRTVSAHVPAAYWALDDGKDAAQLANSVADGPALVGSLTAHLAAVSDPALAGAPGAYPELFDPSAVAGTGSATAAISGIGTTWSFGAWFRMHLKEPITEVLRAAGQNPGVLTIRTTGNIFITMAFTFVTFDAGVTIEEELDTWLLDATTRVGVGLGGSLTGFGTWRGVNWAFTQVDAFSTRIDYVDPTYGLLFLETIGDAGNPFVVGAPISVTVGLPPANPGLWGDAMSIVDSVTMAQLVIFDGGAVPLDLPAAGIGFQGELAANRLVRLGAEHGISVTVAGDPAETVAMGVQPADTLVNVLRECEAADGGVLYDGLGPGLSYATRTSRYNVGAALTADMSADPPQVAVPFSPVDDDQRNRNVVKVDRRDGSSKTAEDIDGPLGTTAIGTYDTSLTLNLATDDDLLHHAARQVGLGTVEGFRYPQLSLDLAATPSLAPDWLRLAVSERLDVVNVTSRAVQHPPDDIAQIVEGWSEVLGPFDWRATVNCAPYQPWEVFVLEATANRGRMEMTQTLGSGVDSSATSLSLVTPVGDPVTTDSATYSDDFPFDVNVDGEQMTVTAISGTISPQTATVTRSVNGVAIPHVAGSTVTLWKAGVLPL